MTVITGDLILVTDRPATVTEVWIRAGEIRTHDGGLIVDDRDREPVHNGWLEINVLPGPAILTLVSHGTVQKAIPIVVPDAEATSLEDAVNAARLAQPSLKVWLEELAASIIAGTKGPKGDRGPEGKQGPAGPAPYIQNGTWWTGGVDTGINATGPQGDPGIAPHIQDETWWVGDTDTGIRAQGPKGDPGPTGTLDLIDESVQTTIDTVAIPAIEGARDEALGKVAGAVAAEVDAIKWKRGILPREITNLADVPDGDWIVASVSHATDLGLPAPRISWIRKSRFGTAIFYDVTTGGPKPQSWKLYGDTGEWQRLANLDDIPAPWWRGASPIPAGETLESIAMGEYTIWSASHAATLGLPTATQGELDKKVFGNTTTWYWLAYLDDGFREWKRRVTTAGVDTGWVDISGHGDDPGMEVTPAGMKLVPLALTLGQGSTTAAGGVKSGVFRVPIRYAAPITRWRLCFTNRNPRYGTTRNAQSMVDTIIIGEHIDGAYTSGWKWVAKNLTVSADGSVARTGWQTTPIGDGRDMAISYRYTTSGPEAPPLLVGGGWDLGTATPGEWDVPRTRVIRLPFDMWIEAETYATTPVIAGFGDSITCGVGATLPVFDSWPSVYARNFGALPIHYSSSGDTFENWGLDEKAYKVSRWDHLARPDAVLWAMGTNDMASSRTLAQHQANTLKMAGIIRERWSPNLYMATIMPRNNEAAEIKAMRDQWNGWAPTQPEFRDAFDFAAAVRDPASGGILPAYNADGLHLSSAGSAAQAAAITRPITAPPVMYAMTP